MFPVLLRQLRLSEGRPQDHRAGPALQKAESKQREIFVAAMLSDTQQKKAG